MNIKPLGNRLLLKAAEVEEKTKGGLILPGTVSKEANNIGEVMALGTGDELGKLKVGDKVIFEKYGNTEIKDNDEVYLIVDLERVLAVID